ncbi:uncharacterized protein LOC122575203 isoform X8 [Bombus pyrosoma]|uniref:uncharacterized protein LOC122575203 isoform X8 n=1 Tax=Bombus pyrosoma TaxID=396416 RepID=UPI001CB8CDD7|nr:uncharacterized protein LOC122575203 isoform X8 [Bombus pyrosoma]
MQEISETVRQIVEFEDLVSRLNRINDVGRPLTNNRSVIEGRIGTTITLPTTTITATLTRTTLTTTKSLSNWTSNTGSLLGPRYVAPGSVPEFESESVSKLGTVPVPASAPTSTSASVEFASKQQSPSFSPIPLSLSSSAHSDIESAVKSVVDRAFNFSSTLDRRRKDGKVGQREQEQRVRVNIGIDEDLRMILEMDPSIVDGTLTSSPLHGNSRNNGHVAFARPLRSTRPQGCPPTFKTATPTSRTQLKLQLMREQLQEQERREAEFRQNLQQQRPTTAPPRPVPTTTLSTIGVDVPPQVLQVCMYERYWKIRRVITLFRSRRIKCDSIFTSRFAAMVPLGTKAFSEETRWKPCRRLRRWWSRAHHRDQPYTIQSHSILTWPRIHMVPRYCRTLTRLRPVQILRLVPCHQDFPVSQPATPRRRIFWTTSCRSKPTP